MFHSPIACLHQFDHHSVQSTGPAPGRAKHLRRRMVLESLEDRTLLSNSLPLTSSQWTPYGPAPILGNVAASEAPGGLPTTGRVTGVAASPTDPSTIFIATAGGGV